MRLTRRQTEVLRLLAEGRTWYEIAAELRISWHTVHRHMNNARERLGAEDRSPANLVHRAWQEGVLP